MVWGLITRRRSTDKHNDWSRQTSSESTTSHMDVDEFQKAPLDPVSAWVEQHAAAAWQQAPPVAEPDHLAASSPRQLPEPARLGPPVTVAAAPDSSFADAEPLRGHSQYRKSYEISRGQNSFVQLAVDEETGQQVAVKFVRRDALDVEKVTREVLNQRLCAGHPHIVALREVFVTEQHLALVMDYCNGSDLAALVGECQQRGESGVCELDARYYFQQLVMAVDYCHCLGIALRDIKVDNMLLHWGRGAGRPLVRLCDFGHSRAGAGGGACTSACGTPEYMAPEVLYGADYCGRAADVWAMGVSLYVLLAGGFPFMRPADDESPLEKGLQAMFLRIVSGRYAPVPHLSPEARHLLHVMLRPAPGDRIPLDDILSHPWFVKDLPPALRSVNADLICGNGSPQADPCRQTEAELAALVARAAAGGSGVRRPADLLWGRRSRGAGRPPPAGQDWPDA